MAKAFWGGGVMSGSGEIRVAVILDDGDIFYFFYFISRFYWRSHFGMAETCKVAESF